MCLKCLVFDCDGVLLDSVPLKTMAFARLAEPYGPEARDRFIMYHMRHGGISRFQKFAWFFREVLDREITPGESAEWGNKFAEYALDEVRRCPLIPGARETLEKWHARLPMYVCSGAPAAELLLILEERGLKHFFTAILGSPPAKSQLLRRIVYELADLEPEQVVMVGDAPTDHEAAEEVGTFFYGVGPELKGGRFPWSMNLVPLNGWIEEHVD